MSWFLCLNFVLYSLILYIRYSILDITTVGKKKRKVSHNNRKSPRSRFPRISLPEGAKRLIWSVVMFALALIFSFSFFEKAGTAGALLFRSSEFLVGRVVFVLPSFLVISGFVLWRMKRYHISPVFFSIFLLVVGAAGIVGGIARENSEDVKELAGWIGFAVATPLFVAFGFWVTEIILGAVMLAALIIFWQLLPHKPKEEGRSLTRGAQEEIKKMFEPKFEVGKVEPEPKIRETIQESEGGETKQKKIFTLEKGKKKTEILPLPQAGNYKAPPVELLEAEKEVPNAGDIKNFSAIIKKTLQNFDIPVEILEVNIGPTVTQYAFKPAEGIKLSRIVGLQNDLSLALAAHPLRIEAPIPGRALVGIELPNKTRATVRLRSLLENTHFKDFPSPLAIALGRDVSGNSIIADLANMPHMLVAGATGTGKTIGLNTIIMSLIFRNSPDNLRLILVDPKRVEFPVYSDLPHLLTPVIFDAQQTLNALKWLVKEMERRFQVLSAARIRDIASYHALVAAKQQKPESSGTEDELESMPYLVLIIDELADLMASRGKEMEAMIVRLAQMARAVGIHLVLATQRPSVEILTGLIKANITSRVAFQVASQIDSRTILDAAGAEKLLGRGDMLFISSEFSKPRRIQGAYVSDKDIKKTVQWIAKESEGFAKEDMEGDNLSQSAQEGLEGIEFEDDKEDPLYEEAKRWVIESRKASASLLQRRLRIGYARAARLIDILEERGMVGPGEGAKPREVYGVSPTDDGEDHSEWKQP